MHGKNYDYLLGENERLVRQRDDLQKKLTDANEVIEYIKKGKIDAVLNNSNETVSILVSKTSDLAYRKFIENMSEGVVTAYTDGIILYSNSSFAALMNVPLEKVIGANLLDFIPAEYIDKFEYYFKNGNINNVKLELTLVDPAGSRKDFIVSVNMLNLQDFTTFNFVWSDVSEQKATENRLRFLNETLKKAIDELIFSENRASILNYRLEDNIKTLQVANIELATFAHIASHDLQEPLRKILTFSSILRNEYYNDIDEQGQNYINKIQSASARMRNLIQDILQYSELSQADISFKLVNLQSIIGEIITDLEIVITETKAQIIIKKQLPVIEASAIQIRQLFQNLLSNSLKFVKAGVIPKIEITYKKAFGKEISENMSDEEYYIFTVKDNGIGFSPDFKNKIFTIFQKLHNNETFKGTGIGLAICKKIVDKHHGFIFAESALNEGALFKIILPVNQSAYKE